MDWYTWISKSCLPPSLAHEYGHLFFNNELEEEDIKHLDHELLLSMGISVGKHRLEILKLARKERKGITSVVKRLGKRVSAYVQMLTDRRSSAIVVVPKAAGGEWRVSKGKTSNRMLKAEKQGRLMITSGENTEVRWDSMFKDLKTT